LKLASLLLFLSYGRAWKQFGHNISWLQVATWFAFDCCAWVAYIVTCYWFEFVFAMVVNLIQMKIMMWKNIIASTGEAVVALL
jgi:hypothetical protein